jgi:hypothetical protein
MPSLTGIDCHLPQVHQSKKFRSSDIPRILFNNSGQLPEIFHHLIIFHIFPFFIKRQWVILKIKSPVTVFTCHHHIA